MPVVSIFVCGLRWLQQTLPCSSHCRPSMVKTLQTRTFQQQQLTLGIVTTGISYRAGSQVQP